jgi:hypothetical protein
MSAKKRKTGEIAAALTAVCIGLTGMIASHIWSVADQARANLFLLKIGSWIPAWWGIGPYAGKETIGLVLWLGSWVPLHFVFKRLEISLKGWAYGFIAAFALIVIMTWPPVYHAIWGWLPTLPF